ncbi:hypothetical protein K402DRAFT_399820 [Aulographum hederae CBS 113979]|uniref:DRBM domain-containing protein n=1 Tax=Aulographum hederae CBS 113979 TaxID=1176131 RepID=A0A6G1HFQ7_9PEZI|nr:hypothetical protein K402DRAFT_399820 [Aulographum hederae CBS 113979]
MFHIMYLQGLCQRRQWPEPYYETYRAQHGWECTVRVNNREYTSDTEYTSEELARNAAATRAYMMCRNFIVHDGMYPGQRADQSGVVQGLPVAIGAGRRNNYTTRQDYEAPSSMYVENESGGSSPRSSESDLDAGNQRWSKSSSSPPSNRHSCFCGRGKIRAYERCAPCLRESGWRV